MKPVFTLVEWVLYYAEILEHQEITARGGEEIYPYIDPDPDVTK